MPPASTLHLSTPGPAQGGPAGLAGRLAGRQALVGGLVVLAVVAIGVLAAVRVFSPPSATASPGASQGGADPTAASTQSIDIAAPTGGALRLVPTAGLTPPAGAALATSLDIVVEIADHPTDGSGVASYLVSNAPSRPPLADAQAYRASFPWRLGQADGLAGPRTVYVWFGDTLGNWMVEPVFATIDFDNPPVPVANQVYDLTAGELCANYGVQHDMNLTLLPYLATDVDGNDGLRVLRVWTGNEQFEGGLDLSGGLSADGASVSITFNLTSPARQRFTDYFTVSDAAGATADGSFGIDVGECP
jgi:hypothetical protein